jgi:type IV pilus assembly protein PilX
VSVTRASWLNRQRGVTLYVVLIFVLLSMLLVLWASRTALFGEMVVGNDADYQRAFEAAQALLQDAELDIRNENATGGACVNGGQPCRQGKKQLPGEGAKLTGWFVELQSEAPATGCKDALCIKRAGPGDFWNDKNALALMTAPGVGARYGEMTGAQAGKGANPILAEASDPNKGGWYWIEVLPYHQGQGGPGVIVDASVPAILPLHLNPNVVYRITALTYGRKPSTKVVLQETYADKPLAN